MRHVSSGTCSMLIAWHRCSDRDSDGCGVMACRRRRADDAGRPTRRQPMVAAAPTARLEFEDRHECGRDIRQGRSRTTAAIRSRTTSAGHRQLQVDSPTVTVREPVPAGTPLDSIEQRLPPSKASRPDVQLLENSEAPSSAPARLGRSSTTRARQR